MSNSTQIATIAGIPIKVHITLWIILPIIAIFSRFGPIEYQLINGFIIAVLFFTCIAIHELGHSFVAMKKGIHVRQILLTPLGGIASIDGMPSNPKDEILIAAAGPATSLLLAMFFGFISMLLLHMGNATPLIRTASQLIAGISYFNIAIALFNLLPSFPMDGGRIFRAWMVPKVGRLEATRRAAKVGRIIAVALGIVGILSFNVLLIGIAIFIYFTAGAEYRAIQFQETFMKNVFTSGGRPQQQNTQQPPPPRREYDFDRDDDSFRASSPPYAGTRTPQNGQNQKKRIKNVFDDLYSDWH